MLTFLPLRQTKTISTFKVNLCLFFRSQSEYLSTFFIFAQIKPISRVVVSCKPNLKFELSSILNICVIFQLSCKRKSMHIISPIFKPKLCLNFQYSYKPNLCVNFPLSFKPNLCVKFQFSFKVNLCVNFQFSFKPNLCVNFQLPFKLNLCVKFQLSFKPNLYILSPNFCLDFSSSKLEKLILNWHENVKIKTN